jgi:hypothetical protein
MHTDPPVDPAGDPNRCTSYDPQNLRRRCIFPFDHIGNHYGHAPFDHGIAAGDVSRSWAPEHDARTASRLGSMLGGNPATPYRLDGTSVLAGIMHRLIYEADLIETEGRPVLAFQRGGIALTEQEADLVRVLRPPQAVGNPGDDDRMRCSDGSVCRHGCRPEGTYQPCRMPGA